MFSANFFKGEVDPDGCKWPLMRSAQDPEALLSLAWTIQMETRKEPTGSYSTVQYFRSAVGHAPPSAAHPRTDPASHRLVPPVPRLAFSTRAQPYRSTMSKNRITGLASSFEAPATSSSPAPSAVSALASRFDAPPPTSSSDPQVSEKVSGIASRFGATVADTAAPPRKPGTPSARFDKQEQSKANPVVEEKPDFGEITKRFASGGADQKEAAEGEEAPNMFAAAASAFRKREEEARPQTEGKVSAFKRDFKGGKKAATSAKKEKQVSVPAEMDKVVEEKRQSFGSIASRFESGATGSENKDGGEGLVNRFEESAKIFTGEEKATETGEEDSVKSRFADAAKLFGGGAGN